MFGGSENVKGRFMDHVEQLGPTYLNGTTNENRTNYFETVPVSTLDRMLFIESDPHGAFLQLESAKRFWTCNEASCRMSCANMRTSPTASLT
jgi:hypothetical protein